MRILNAIVDSAEMPKNCFHCRFLWSTAYGALGLIDGKRMNWVCALNLEPMEEALKEDEYRHHGCPLVAEETLY